MQRAALDLLDAFLGKQQVQVGDHVLAEDVLREPIHLAEDLVVVLRKARLVLRILAGAQVHRLVRLVAKEAPHGSDVLRLRKIALLQQLLLLFDSVHGLAQLAAFLEYGRHVLDESRSAATLIVLQAELALEVDAPRVDVTVAGHGEAMLCTARHLRDLMLLLAQLHSLIGSNLVEVHLVHGTVAGIKRSRRLLVVDKLVDARQLRRDLLLTLRALQLVDLLVQLLHGLERARAQLTMNV